MYRAKQTGAGTATYEAKLDTPARMRLRDIEELRKALREHELVLHYQPVIGRVPGRNLQHLEALVRWEHPERGLVGPRDFLPLAQSTGLIGDLTGQVILQALADAHAWRRAGHPVQVSVNVTAESVARPGLAEQLLDLLAGLSLPADALRLELRESELLVSGPSASLTALHAAGVSIAVDDFGTGYSPLADLADLPLDTIKLDPTFVRRLHDGQRSRMLVTRLVDFVHGLGFDVVAEGVEERQESRVLATLGVGWQQGFLFSRPMPAADTARWLAAHQIAGSPA